MKKTIIKLTFHIKNKANKRKKIKPETPYPSNFPSKQELSETKKEVVLVQRKTKADKKTNANKTKEIENYELPKYRGGTVFLDRRKINHTEANENKIAEIQSYKFPADRSGVINISSNRQINNTKIEETQKCPELKGMILGRNKIPYNVRFVSKPLTCTTAQSAGSGELNIKFDISDWGDCTVRFAENSFRTMKLDYDLRERPLVVLSWFRNMLQRQRNNNISSPVRDGAYLYELDDGTMVELCKKAVQEKLNSRGTNFNGSTTYEKRLGQDGKSIDDINFQRLSILLMQARGKIKDICISSENIKPYQQLIEYNDLSVSNWCTKFIWHDIEVVINPSNAISSAIDKKYSHTDYKDDAAILSLLKREIRTKIKKPCGVKKSFAYGTSEVYLLKDGTLIITKVIKNKPFITKVIKNKP